MLKKILSEYFLEKFISNIEEKRKLCLFIYNKDLQKKLDLSIVNYIELSGKYTVEDRNGITKEYNSNNDKLIFKGEYLNGKRNGKGKEYFDEEHIRYVGQYLNGKRNGKGKEYYKNEQLKFNGEYLNGKKNGKCKEYYKTGSLQFEGEYLNGKKWNGKGYDKENKCAFEIKDGKGDIKEFDKYGKILFKR